MPKDKTIELLRHELGSIDLFDIGEEKEESEGSRKEYCAAIAAVFPRLEKDIKRFLHAQLMYASNQAETWEQVIFGRGTFNGIDLLYNYWKIANDEHFAKVKEVNEPKGDKHNPIGEFNN